MKRVGLWNLVLVFIAMIICTKPATAECSTTAYGKVASGYVLQDLAIMASREPSLQAGATATCGKWSYDLWTATELSGSGRYGERGYGDEIDVTVSYNDSVETPVGQVAIEASASYYLLSSFADGKDDMLQLYVDAGRPFEFGLVTVTPFARLIQWVGLGTLQDETLLRPGVRANIKISETMSLSGDVSMNFLLNSDTHHARSQINLTKDFGKGLTGGLEVKLTQGAPTVAAVVVTKRF